MKVLPTIEANMFKVPDAFVHAIATYCNAERERAGQLGIAVPFESQDGQAALAAMVAEHWPRLRDLSRLLRNIIDLEPSCVVVRGLGFTRYAAEVRDTLVLALTAAIGKPTDHNGDKRVLWPVRLREAASNANYKTTFSEQVSEAPLHSDSAFAPQPEKFNCLFVVREAEDGGGLSVLVNVRQLMAELDSTADGRECLAILREQEFPFRVPDAFFTGNRVITAPIIADKPLIRFRYDCVMDGFKLRDDLRTNDRIWAVQHFRDAAENSDSRLLYQLRRGEALIFNNHELLHARTNFEDPERYLIRVRMHAA